MLDDSDGSRHFFSGQVNADAVDVFDQTAGAHITGSSNAGWFSLHHFADAHRLELAQQRDGLFTGIDHRTDKPYQVIVSGSRVAVFDYEHETWHTYSV